MGQLDTATDIDFEAMSIEERKAFFDALDKGSDTVEVPDKALKPLADTDPVPVVNPPKGNTEEPTPPPAPETTTPAAEPPADTKDAPKKPANYQEAMAAWNTEKQKREARDRLLKKLEDPTFATTYMQERGIPVVVGQNASVEARKIELAEHAAAQAEEITNREYRRDQELIASAADSTLREYDTGTSDGLIQADAKWRAVVAELGNDQEKLQKYVEDPEFRKTVKAIGPEDPKKFVQMAQAVQAWIADPSKPLQKYLDFYDVPRRTQTAPAQSKQAPALSVEARAANAEAERLAQRAQEPVTLPNSSNPGHADADVTIQEILARADRVGIDNLSQAERDRVHQYYGLD